jgi:TonB family protein
MFWRLLIIAAMAIAAHGAELAGPSEFYVVSQFFSDYGAQFYYRDIDVKQVGSDSVIRYARVAPTNVYCRRLIIQAVEARVRDKSPAQLVGINNPCAVKPAALRAALHKYPQRGGGFETISFGIVAQCGPSSVSLGLPAAEGVNLNNLKSAYPAMVRLWDLSADIIDPAFGPTDIFHDRSEQDDLVLQLAGEKLVTELISGRYDIGLAAAVRGNVGTWKDPSFRSLLVSYQGPIGATEAKASYVPKLLNSTAYRFTDFVAPEYPRLAMMARIQGTVELQLTLGPATGEVHSVSAVSGHPLLTPTAIEAAKQWRFAQNSVGSETITIAIEYALRCQ